MKIIIVGGTGTIGSAVANELSSRHDVIIVGHQQSDIRVDISDAKSIKEMYEKIGYFDAVISTAGKVHFGPLLEMNQSLYEIGLNNKLMGQVNLVLLGLPYLADNGSFTLTSGILSHDPIRYGSSASMVNGALESFVKSAALEMPRGIRINAVSPTVVSESMPQYASYFRGFKPVEAKDVALGFSKSVEGAQTGQVYTIN